MSLNIFNPDKIMVKAAPRKQYAKPEEVLNDEHLTPTQKRLVLEAMLTEAKDMMRFDDEGGTDNNPRQPSRFVDEILKAKSKLCGKMV